VHPFTDELREIPKERKAERKGIIRQHGKMSPYIFTDPVGKRGFAGCYSKKALLTPAVAEP
jgi:hypothetical protein